MRILVLQLILLDLPKNKYKVSDNGLGTQYLMWMTWMPPILLYKSVDRIGLSWIEIKAGNAIFDILENKIKSAPVYPIFSRLIIFS